MIGHHRVVRASQCKIPLVRGHRYAKKGRAIERFYQRSPAVMCSSTSHPMELGCDTDMLVLVEWICIVGAVEVSFQPSTTVISKHGGVGRRCPQDDAWNLPWRSDALPREVKCTAPPRRSTNKYNLAISSDQINNRHVYTNSPRRSERATVYTTPAAGTIQRASDECGNVVRRQSICDHIS